MSKKISFYDLLGLIKDRKAPKKIKYEDIMWEYDLQENEYIKDGDYWLFQDYFPNNLNFLDCLQDKVEIIEEDKPTIEKIDTTTENTLFTMECYTGIPEQAQDWNFNVLKDKINEIIDYISKKEDK